MATAPEATVNINKINTRQSIVMTVTLKGMRWWKLKLGLGVLIIKLGVWVMGVGCKFEDDSDE